MDRDTLEAAAARLGAELVKARRSRKLSQRSLAARVGMSRMTVANLEAGRGTVTAVVTVLSALAHRFTEQPADLELGAWLAHARKRIGLSQERLSIQASVSRPAIMRVERGEGTIATMIAAMTALGLPPSLTEVAIGTVPAPLPAPTARLLQGDCRDRMRGFAEEGLLFDAIVTDPPYHLASISRRFGRARAAALIGGEPGSLNPYRSMASGFMGQQWDGGDIAFDAETWRAAFNTLKPGGYLVAFGGTRTFHRLAVAIEDAGFEIRDTIMWVFGSGFPKSHNVGRGIEGLKLGSARYSGQKMPSEQGSLPPGKLMREMANHEWTGRVVRVEGQDARQWQGHGTALKPGYEPILIARKPIYESSVAANVLKFGTGSINIDACRVPFEDEVSPSRLLRESAQRSGNAPGRPGQQGRTITNRISPARYMEPRSGEELGRWPANVIHDGIDETWGRYFYAAKASKVDRGPRNGHPTVKPNSLMRYLARLVTPPGGTVFDPFMGSGSTGVAAVQEGFSFVGCDQQPEYVEIARRRIAKVLPENGSALSDLPLEEPAIRNAS